MFERWRKVLVDTYISALALGYLLAADIIHFVNMFAAPVASWISRKQYGSITHTIPVNFSLQDALPELLRFMGILLVWLVLMRWLYVKPAKTNPSDPDVQKIELK